MNDFYINKYGYMWHNMGMSRANKKIWPMS